jgi:cell envelope opacity-associated protein A
MKSLSSSCWGALTAYCAVAVVSPSESSRSISAHHSTTSRGQSGQAEEKALLKTSEASGKNLREWAREVLLERTNLANQPEMPMHIFTELVAIQMLLMNTLEPLLRGDRMQTEQIKLLYRQVQTAKAVQAQELLEMRAKRREEEVAQSKR